MEGSVVWRGCGVEVCVVWKGVCMVWRGVWCGGGCGVEGGVAWRGCGESGPNNHHLFILPRALFAVKPHLVNLLSTYYLSSHLMIKTTSSGHL